MVFYCKKSKAQFSTSRQDIDKERVHLYFIPEGCRFVFSCWEAELEEEVWFTDDVTAEVGGTEAASPESQLSIETGDSVGTGNPPEAETL